jgi:hypothetical protein
MQSCYVTEPDKPFRAFSKLFKIQFVKNADSSVTSSATDYSSHFVIIHSVLQILQTLTVRAGEPAELTFRMMRYTHLQTPRAQHVRRPVYQSRLNSP